MNDLLDEWKKITKNIKIYDKSYNKGLPIIKDEVYDALKSRLSYIESIMGPQKNSPLDEVRKDIGNAKVKHNIPMLSLDNGFGPSSVLSFTTKRIEYLPFVAEHKVDGVALSLRYQDGFRALTRGNKLYGIDVTHQISYVEIPRNIPKHLEVRGELYMTFLEFKKVSNKFSSPRNACAALIQNKKPLAFLNISFIAHNLFGDECKTYEEKIRYLRILGFQTTEYKVCTSVQESVDYFNYIEQNRATIPYPIDGLVYKINSIDAWSDLGSHKTAPRYAFAAKFNPLFKKTKILDIVAQVGKFGNITPVAIFEPILIDGHNIRKATLHNLEECAKNHYGIGDEIIVSRAGDTVPYIKEKITHANNEFTISNCPSCGSLLSNFICNQGWKCLDQKIQRIMHFCSRNAFNIEGIGSKIVEDFVHAKHIDTPDDIFVIAEKISRGEIVLKNRWGEKSIKNLIASLDRARKVKLSNFIFGICIPHVGLGVAQVIAENFNTFAQFIDNYTKDLPYQVRGVGDKTADSIKLFLQNESWIYRLVEHIEIV